MTPSLLPLLVIFNLDALIWPFWHDADVPIPYANINGTVVDTYGDAIKYAPELPAVFEKLKSCSIKIAILESSSTVNHTIQLINLFEWINQVSFTEIHEKPVIKNIVRFQKKSKIPFHEMIFFSTFQRTDDIEKLGVTCIYVDYVYGITLKLLDEGLKKYESSKQPQIKDNNDDDFLFLEQ